MRNVKIGLFVLSIILFTQIISAVPPFETTTTQLIIKYPADDVIEKDHDYIFEFHIFNTTGVPIIQNIGCKFHLYNDTGEHQYIGTQNSPSGTTTFDYEFVVDKGNFSRVGEYYYVIQCNSTAEGGYDTIPIRITKTGEGKIETGVSNIIIFSTIIPLLISVLFFILGIKSKNKIILIIFIGISSVFLLISSLFNMVLIDNLISNYPVIIEGYSTFIMVVKTIFTIGVLALVLYAGLVALKLWRIKRGLIDY